jgi:predicted transport protein
MLAWVSDNVKELVNILGERVAEFGDVNRAVHGRYLCFYRGKPSVKSIFAAFLLTKKALKARIRTDPSTFRDPQKWTGDKIYKGWFFKQGQEREFKIFSKDQLSYAIELIKQSYEISI